MNRLAAMDVRPPQVMEQFSLGQRREAGMQAVNIRQAQQVMELVGSAAISSMGGRLDGTPDPKVFDSIIDDFVGMGVKGAERFRGRSDTAPALVRASLTALDQLNRADSKEKHDLAVKRFDLDIAKAMQTKPPSGYQWNPDGSQSPIPGGPADPSNPLNRKRIEGRNSFSVTTNPDGTTTTTFGGSNGPALGRKAAGRLQAGAISNTELLDQMDTVAGSYDPAFLTYKGQGEGFFTRQAEKIGLKPGQAKTQFLKRRTKFITGVERLFNEYRRVITGAAAAVQELDRLKKSFINADMSPSEFEAAFEGYQDELRRTLRLRNRLLREGRDPRTKEGGTALDRLHSTAGDDDIQARYSELTARGFGEEQIFKILKREGYKG